jgi:hypothetical protein
VFCRGRCRNLYELYDLVLTVVDGAAGGDLWRALGLLLGDVQGAVRVVVGASESIEGQDVSHGSGGRVYARAGGGVGERGWPWEGYLSQR